MNDRQSDEEAIFHIARKIADAGKRDDYLDRESVGNPSLRKRVEALLEAHEQDESFLKSKEPVATTAAASRRGDFESKQIGPYKIREQIGEGGMGIVYVAQQQSPVKRKVALKVIKPGMDSKEVVARFEAERQALAMMDHPGIAKVFDGGVTETGQPYFAMELINGIPITQYCDEQKLGIGERLELFVAVCHAVQHAHQKGVIHRDIKPTNVLVTLHDGKPVPVVIDFGVAKATNQNLTDQTIYTRLHQVVGTTLYMSPEQAELSRFGVDTRADIYSLGVLLYEMLAGTTPFDRERFKQAALDEVRRIIREEEPPKPSTRLSTLGENATRVSSLRRTDPQKLRHSLRGDLDWIVMMALEKDRNRRYETANGLAMDVERFLSNEPILARPPSTWYRMQKFYSRNQTLTLSSLLVAVSLTTGMCFAIWGMNRAKENAGQLEQERNTQQEIAGQLEQERNKQQEIAENYRRELYASDMNGGVQMWNMNDLPNLKMALDRWDPRLAGSVHQGPKDLRGWDWKFLSSIVRSNLDVTTVKQLHAIPMHLSTSIDGSRIAVSTPEYPAISVFDQTGKPIWEENRYLGDRWQVPAELSPCGRYLAFKDVDWKGVIIRDLDACIEREVVGDWEGVYRIKYSANGKTLFVGSRGGRLAMVQVQDPASFQELRILDFSLTALAVSPDNQFVFAGGDDGSVKKISVSQEDGDDHEVTDLTSVKLHDKRINDIAVSNDGRWLATASSDGRCSVVSMENGQLRKQIVVSRQEARVATFDFESKRLAVGCGAAT